MSIPYIKNDSTDTIELLVDVYENMQKFMDLNIIDFPSDNYADNCVNMCNISTYVIGGQLIDFCEPGQLLVKEGVFNMSGNHTWIEIEGIIIDATLCQFREDANPLSLIDSSWKAYQEVKSYTYDDWVKNSPNMEEN